MIKHILADIPHKASYDISELIDFAWESRGRLTLVSLGITPVNGALNLTVTPQDAGYSFVRERHAAIQVAPDEKTNELRLALSVPPFQCAEWGSGVLVVRKGSTMKICPDIVFSPFNLVSKRTLLEERDMIYLGNHRNSSYGPVFYYQTK